MGLGKWLIPGAPVYAAAKGVNNMLGSKPNPMDKGNEYFNQIDPMMREHFQPYAERGNNASNTTYDIYNQFATDPADYYDKMFGNYKASSGFDKKMTQAMHAAQNNAGIGGYANTPYAQSQAAEIANSLGNDDFQKWYENVMGLQTQGMTGLGEHAATGYNAHENMADVSGNTLSTQGGLAYNDQQAKNNAKREMFSSLMKLFASGAGAAFGGPAGGAVGGALGTAFSGATGRGGKGQF